VEIAKLGVNGYILKPFRQETFDQEVSKVLGAPGAGTGAQGATYGASRDAARQSLQ
jgi:hypothetical protein